MSRVAKLLEKSVTTLNALSNNFLTDFFSMRGNSLCQWLATPSKPLVSKALHGHHSAAPSSHRYK